MANQDIEKEIEKVLEGGAPNTARPIMPARTFSSFRKPEETPAEEAPPPKPNLTVTEWLAMLDAQHAELRVLINERYDIIEAKLDAILTTLR